MSYNVISKRTREILKTAIHVCVIASIIGLILARTGQMSNVGCAEKVGERR